MKKFKIKYYNILKNLIVVSYELTCTLNARHVKIYQINEVNKFEFNIFSLSYTVKLKLPSLSIYYFFMNK